MASFFDTHAHLDYPDFQDDFVQVLTRAMEAGITRVITIGVDLESSRRALEISERHPEVFAAVGWHPCHALEAPDDLRPASKELAAHPKAVAIGETGLDFHHWPSEKPEHGPADDDRYREKQQILFRQQLEVAAETGLNCVIHQRDAFEASLAEIQPWAGKVRGVFHCFANDTDSMRRVMELGGLVSFTGILTFKNAARVRETLAATPLDRFMLETDCPYLAPVPYRGKRCEPAYVKEIAATASEVKGCSLEELSSATCGTAFAFFPKLNSIMGNATASRPV
jgi:TatD DNase family protein